MCMVLFCSMLLLILIGVVDVVMCIILFWIKMVLFMCVCVSVVGVVYNVVEIRVGNS